MQPDDRYDSLIRWYASIHGRDARQVKRQIRVESAFDPDAKSPAGALGLMQFMPATWREWWDGAAGTQAPPSGMTFDPANPEWSIRAGCAYMAWLQKQLGSLALALAAYNWGIGNCRKIAKLDDWRSQLPQETRDYVRKCLDFQNESVG